MKYYHELTEKERKELYSKKMTRKEFFETYKQPDWCDYPNALEPYLGCWALIFGDIKKYEDCKNCEYRKK